MACVSAMLIGCKQKTMQKGIELSHLDTTMAPGTDFYRYACGGWMDANPLPAEYSRYGNFEAVYETSNKQLLDLIHELSEEDAAVGSLQQKIGDLYNIAMDSVKQNEAGISPIMDDLVALDGMTEREAVAAMVGTFSRKGVPGFFTPFINADLKNSTQNLFYIYQGGLTLDEKEYYLDTDEATTAIREAYKVYVEKMFQLCGFTEEQACRKMEEVLRIETRIAGVSSSATELRNPEANYHKMSYEDLLRDYPGVDWDAYFAAAGVKGLREVCVGQPKVITEVGAILQEEDLSALKSFIEWKLIDTASPYLTDDLRACRFDFYGRAMSGAQQDRPRWKKAVSTVDGVLGEAVGRLYVEKYFPAAAKERMVNLVRNLQEALKERILVQDWMSDETKKVALEKLAAFRVKIGYPDTWRDYTALEIKNDSYWANIVRSSEFEMDYILEKNLNKPVDREEWLITPQTVNAYYNPTTNEICFPAGILQPPFFSMEADDACNYGAIGVVIGHEMTHGFDDKGRLYDKNGNLTEWWSKEDAERFMERADVMRAFFDNIEVLPGLKANGTLTLGENLADHGGLMVAYAAFRKATEEQPLGIVDGFTPEQRFFLSYANVWAGNIRDEEIRKRTMGDPHSLGRWRVNGALPHIDMWYEAFGITESDSLYIPKEERVTIW